MSPRILPALALVASLTLPSANAQLRWVDDIPATFIDISATGTNLNIPTDGEANALVAIGNALFPPGTLRVGGNGGLRFNLTNGATQLSSANSSLPSTLAFNGERCLLPYWDELDLTFGNVFIQSLPDRLVVQWNRVQVAGAIFSDRITFQVQIPRFGPVRAQIVYSDIAAGISDGGRSATIGFQGGGQLDDLQWSFNAPDAVRNGLVLSLVDVPGDTALVEGIPGTFIDISGTGTPLNLTDDAEVNVATTLRGRLLRHFAIRIGANGGIRLGPQGLELAPENAAIPSATVFNGAQALLPFWDDIDTAGGTQGNVFFEERSDRIIVQWENVGFHFVPQAGRATFQVQLFGESTLAAQFLYEDIDGPRAGRGGSATIGYQAGSIGADVTHGFNTPSVDDGVVLTLLQFAPRTGTNYCTANPNSTGQRGVIRGGGSTSLAANDLTLHASSLPLNAFSFFIFGSSAGFSANPGGSQGNICVGGHIGRGVGNVIVNTGATGTANANVDLLAIPVATGLFVAQPGDTLNFQCWHRDSVGGVAVSNFTNGLQVHVLP